LGLEQALVVSNPIPDDKEMTRELHDATLADALEALTNEQITGKDVTPFLLGYFHEHTHGVSPQASIALVLNNAAIAAEIAVARAAGTNSRPTICLCGIDWLTATRRARVATRTTEQTQQARNDKGTYHACVGVKPVQTVQADHSMGPGETVMQINRRDMLMGAAAATAGSLTILTGAATAPAAPHPTLRVRSDGSQVLALQQRLAALGYWLGGVDGQFGDLTRQAVVAIQKVASLSRDGICGPLTWSRVDAGIRPQARSATGHVVEIRKTTQTLLVVDSGVVKGIYNTCTGSDQRYYHDEAWHVAVTPSGSFAVFRRENTWHNSPLGSLYRPQYFSGGIAVHGYTSVPSTPASHGCCRVSPRAMDDLCGIGGMQVGTCVLVY